MTPRESLAEARDLARSAADALDGMLSRGALSRHTLAEAARSLRDSGDRVWAVIKELQVSQKAGETK